MTEPTGPEPGATGPGTPGPAPIPVRPAPGGLIAADAVPAPGYENIWRERRMGNRGLRLLVLGAAALFILWLARDVIAPFVVAAIVAYAFDPLVSSVVERTRLPRILVIAIGYVIALSVLGAVVYLVAGHVANEFRELTSGGRRDVIAGALNEFFGPQITIAGQVYSSAQVAESIRAALTNTIAHPTDALGIVTHAVDIGLQAILTLILAFYMLLDGDRFASYSLRFLDRRRRARTVHVARRIHVVLGRWLRGQLFLIGLVAVVLYVVLGPILHVQFALTLGIVSGVLEIIPLVGPIVAAAMAVTVAFGTQGTDTAVTVLIVYFIVRQVEDQIIMPLVIGRVVHLHPVVTIFAVLVGLSTFGILGGLLGVPVAAALNVTLHELYPEADEPEATGNAGPAATEGPNVNGLSTEEIEDAGATTAAASAAADRPAPGAAGE